MHIFPNNKKYIGITCKKPQERWRDGEGYRTQPVYKAIKKYGWENIEHQILYVNLTRDEANKKEKELILYYNTNINAINSNGYNVTWGGDGTCGVPQSDKCKEVLSQIRNSYKFKEMLRLRNVENSKKCYQYSLNGDYIADYTSLREASEKYSVSTSSLSYAIKNKTLCSNFQWRFFKKEKITEYVNNKLVPVVQFDLDTGNIINKFNSITEAEEKTSSTNISNVLSKKAKSANGFGWKYDDNNGINLEDYKHDVTGQEVLWYSEDYEFLGKFSSYREAELNTGISYKLISNSVNRKERTGTYIFIKPNDIDKIKEIKRNVDIPIHKYDLDGNYICSYKNRYWVSNNLHIPLRRIGIGFQSGGFQWLQGLYYVEKIPPYNRGNNKSVNQYDKKLNLINTYASIAEAESVTGATNIYMVCNRLRITSGGYIWRYTDDCDDVHNKTAMTKYIPKGKAVYQLNKDFSVVKKFDTLKNAERYTGISSKNICNSLKRKSKTAGGFIWRYADEIENSSLQEVVNE